MSSQVFSQINELLHGFNTCSIAFRIVLSAVIGGFIGFERGYHGRVAGLRTHILVCLGSTLAAIVGLYVAYNLGFNNDPMRVGAQVISGIGFLGVGTIVTRDNFHVTGLTTAAGLWATASIGLAVGIGFYWAAVVAFLVVLVTMSILTRLERERKDQGRYLYYLEISEVGSVNRFQERIADRPIGLQILAARSGLPGSVGLELSVPKGYDSTGLLEELRALDYVSLMVPVSYTAN